MKKQKFTDYDIYTEHITQVVLDTIAKVYLLDDYEQDEDMFKIQIDNWYYTIGFPDSLDTVGITISSGAYLDDSPNGESIVVIPYTDSIKILQTIQGFHIYNQTLETFICDSLDSMVEKYPDLAPAIIENYSIYD